MNTLPREHVLPVLRTVHHQEALPTCAIVILELVESTTLMSHYLVLVSKLRGIYGILYVSDSTLRSIMFHPLDFLLAMDGLLIYLQYSIANWQSVSACHGSE